MALVFHQNMRVYGGNQPVRNGAYIGAFGAINGVTPGAQSYWVAGFTEVMNASAGLRLMLSGLAQIIDPLLTSFVVIEVGITSVGMQREFIAIAWDPLALNVQHLGQVLWNPTTRTWVGYDAAPAFVVNQTRNMPGGVALGADTRGLAYIAGLDVAAGNPYVFGFMHNMFHLGNKTAAFSSLGVMCSRMVIAMNDANYPLATTQFYLGGDFNLRPRNPTARGGKVLSAKAARNGGAAGPPAAYVNTTLANPYDFWVVSDATRTDAHAVVLPQTRIPNASDHAGVRLLF